MPRQKMTEAEKLQAREAKHLKREADAAEQRERIEKEESEWNSVRELEFLRLFLNAYRVKQQLDYHSEKDYVFKHNYDDVMNVDFGVQNIAKIYIKNDWFFMNVDSEKMSRLDLENAVQALSEIQTEIDDYKQVQEQKRIEEEERKAHRESALRKLNPEEKAALGIK